MPTSNVSLQLNYLPLVIFTIRVLVAILGTGWHSFHPLQFLNSLKNRNCILVSTLYGNGGHQVEKLSRHTNLPSTADVVMVVVVVVQSFGADHQFFAGMYSIFIKWHSRLFAFLCFWTNQVLPGLDALCTSLSASDLWDIPRLPSTKYFQTICVHNYHVSLTIVYELPSTCNIHNQDPRCISGNRPTPFPPSSVSQLFEEPESYPRQHTLWEWGEIK